MGPDGEVQLSSPSKLSYKRPLSALDPSPSKKTLIIERYSVPETSSKLDKSMRYAFGRNLLQQEVEQKHQELLLYKKQIMSKKTSIHNQELVNRKLEDEVREITRELREVEENVKQLDEAEKDSIQQIESRVQIKKRELKVNHEKKLMDLKETLSQEIDKVVEETARKNQETKATLEMEISKLRTSLRLVQKERTRRLIQLKENHSRYLHSISESHKVELERVRIAENELQEQIQNNERHIKDLQKEITEQLHAKKISMELELTELQESYSSQEQGRKLIYDKILAANDAIAKHKGSMEHRIKEKEAYGVETEALHELFPSLELKRRQLHAKLHDLKGNIRVFCRIRFDNSGPHSLIETSSPEEFSETGKQDLALSKSEATSQYSFANGIRNEPNLFQFDKIFNTDVSNREIFEEWCQLVQCALDGSRVCVFAYGQTGSGKTYTMSNEADGMIPLSIEKIFDDINELRSYGWEHEIDANFIEIYNENIFDLFAPTSLPVKHEIKHDDMSQTTTVSNLRTKRMHNAKEALEMLRSANKRRATAATDANERSSRSHSVFTIKIKGNNQKSGELKAGLLNLVDLAGSERIGSSHATGARLKETQAINKSLSCLGDVIYSIARKLNNGQNNHVPYRNSKLTYLLKNSLQGNSKTLMFVNILPLLKNFGETLNSLRFATKVNRTKVSQ